MGVRLRALGGHARLPAALLFAAVTAALAGASGCHSNGSGKGPDGGAAAPDGSGSAGAAASADAVPSGAIADKEPPSDKPLLGVTGYLATVYKEPRDTSKKLGYLRLGSKVVRSESPAGKSGCAGGWYQIEPRGFVCAGEDATIDMDAPMLKAAKRANIKTALPYHYAFVRAVLPLYMRVPTAEEQTKSEFKLQEHLDWYKANEAEANKVLLGANDVPIDARGVPIPDKKVGELGLGKNSNEIGIGALLGGETDNDPIPFWLEGGKRQLPNVSDYKVKGFEVFADRARRHTGLSLMGSFPTGPESGNRRFAITADMRLVPASKIKPDTGSPWHGLELHEGLTLPLAFVRSQTAHAYKITHGSAAPAEELEHRSAFALNGHQKTIDGLKYYKTTNKEWLSQADVGLAVAPSTWPDDAEKGKKWIEISITNQTLVLWEGKKPVYATLVSTGKAGLDDPKKTTATVRGSFHIRNKHVSAMMDSNESSSVGGKANSSAAKVAINDDDPKPTKHAAAPAGDKSKGKAAGKGVADKGGKPKGDAKAKVAPAGDKPIPTRGDGEYGVTRRRGEGTFQLRDVPYIQYFESGYALHAAYWHDVFGTPRSHGCVNLSPVDAHRIFFWTEPQVPEGWHGTNSGDDMGEGTLVVIHE